MQRGRLFRTPASARGRLSYTRDILEWVYAANRSPQRLQVDFWDWYCGVAHDQAPVQARPALTEIHHATLHWHWRGIQRGVRERLEEVFATVQTAKSQAGSYVPRALGTWSGADGSRYLHYGPWLPDPLKEADLVPLAVDEILADLSGLALEALGRCEQCQRYLVRLRSTRKRFCSPACTWGAFRDRQAREQGAAEAMGPRGGSGRKGGGKGRKK